jgi:hypothetical protein
MMDRPPGSIGLVSSPTPRLKSLDTALVLGARMYIRF